MNSDLQQRIKKARLDLVLDAPFFGTLAFKLETAADPSVPTTRTDGRTIAVNEEYLSALSQSQLAGTLCESIVHCGIGHLFRRDNRDPDLWEKAADQVAWEMLSHLQETTDGRICLPPSAKIDGRYLGLSAEEVYNKMRDEKQDDQNGQDNGGDGEDQPYQSPGSMAPPAPPDDPDDGDGDGQPDPGNGSGDGTPPPPPPQQSLEDEWKSAVSEAATAERMKQQGNLPAWMKQLVDELLEPKVPWQDYVREFCHRLSRDDYSFRRLNRRHLGRGFALPSLMSESLGPIVGAFDTSGSIFCQMPLVQDLLSELQGVLDLCRPETLHLISCDTQVHQNVEFKPGDSLLQFVPEGGGGTDFRPVFDEIAKLPEPPACLIFLTDLWGTFPDTPPDFPVLWANYGDPKEKAPFGTTIFVPTK